MKKVLGSKIRQLRERRKLTRQQLATELGVNATTLGMWELGERTPPVDMIDKIASFFICSVDYLLGRDTNKIKELDQKQKALIELIGSLTDEQAEHLCNLLATITADTK